ncbi:MULTISPECIES: NUDIX domain-containing protein [unclassified Isoptericola]|uniref:NUDIX domain-containing protein n=1 Tax=unclassified Isoptericola TaxID=2623355 RepID=UPI003654F6C6
MSDAPGAGGGGAGAPLADEITPRPVLRHDVLQRGRIIDLVRDEVDLGDAGVVTREYVEHPGAVAIVALDEQERILLERQYRHPVRSFMWEVPAGLLDVDGEPAVDAAARELAEEADVTAERWAVLADYATTPGSSDEAVRIFLARGIAPVAEADRHVRTGEEAGMEVRWVPLDEAVARALDGSLHNPSTVVGILAAAASRAGGWSSLRPTDAPWPARPGA